MIQQPNSDTATEDTLRSAVKELMLKKHIPEYLQISSKNPHTSLRLGERLLKGTQNTDLIIYGFYALQPRTFFDKLLRIKRYKLYRISNAMLGTWDSKEPTPQVLESFNRDYPYTVKGTVRGSKGNTVKAFTGWKV